MPVQCTCQRCGKAFSLSPSDIAHGKGQHCSRACRFPVIMATCKACSKRFRVTPTHKVFCSRACQNTPLVAGDSRSGFNQHAIERFWSHVVIPDEPDACWDSPLKSEPSGHIRISIGGRRIPLHRMSFVIHFGPIPASVIVCHDCPGGDNPRCSNPRHLFPGNHLDNARDAMKKGLVLKGEAHPRSRLTDEQVRGIRNLRESGVGPKQIAAQYGIGASLVCYVCLHGWKHLT